MSKTVHSSDGTPIFAEAVGDPSNPSVVLVHGIQLSGTVYDNLFADKDLLGKLYMVRVTWYHT